MNKSKTKKRVIKIKKELLPSFKIFQNYHFLILMLIYYRGSLMKEE